MNRLMKVTPQAAARSLKKAGRYGDSELVHVNDYEVDQLRRMSGRAPDGRDDSRNPMTGLPEFYGGGPGSKGGDQNDGGTSGGGSGSSGGNGNSGGNDHGVGSTGNHHDIGGVLGGDVAAEAAAGVGGLGGGFGGNTSGGYKDEVSGFADDVTGTGGVNATNVAKRAINMVAPPGLMGMVELAGLPAHEVPTETATVSAMQGLMGPLSGMMGPAQKGMSMVGNTVGEAINEAMGNAPGTGSGGPTSTDNSGGNDPQPQQMVVDPEQGQQEPEQAVDDDIESMAARYESSINMGRDLADNLFANRPSRLGGIVAGAGRDGDSQAVYASPAARQALQDMGGRGSINPRTGLREYAFSSEAEYLAMYPDVAAAVAAGQFKSGQDHYNTFGKQEIESGQRATGPIQTKTVTRNESNTIPRSTAVSTPKAATPAITESRPTGNPEIEGYLEDLGYTGQYSRETRSTTDTPAMDWLRGEMGRDNFTPSDPTLDDTIEYWNYKQSQNTSALSPASSTKTAVTTPKTEQRMALSPLGTIVASSPTNTRSRSRRFRGTVAPNFVV